LLLYFQLEDFLNRFFWVGILILIGQFGIAQKTFALTTPEEEPPKEYTLNLKEGKTLRFLPRGDLYPPYIAGPHRPGFAAIVGGITDNDINSVGDFRITLKAGGLFGVFQIHPHNRPELGIQFSFEAGIDAQFDLNNSQDNLGWDGNFGWHLTMARPEGWAYKIALLHTSSHLGDEHIEDTGRRRIGYTRRELALGISKQLTPELRTYGELGWGYNPGNHDVQKPIRLQTGIQWEPQKMILWDFFNWYTAIDLSTMEERDWRLDSAVQAGFSHSDQERRYRIGIEVYKGRPTMGEFFQANETHIALGVWVTL
jgi:hypothetical protein